VDLWALRAMYCSGNHNFEMFSFKHRKYLLFSFGVGNQRILWVRIEVFPFKILVVPLFSLLFFPPPDNQPLAVI
jgi:hypothetical protein